MTTRLLMSTLITGFSITLLFLYGTLHAAEPYFAPHLPHTGNVFAARFTSDGKRTISVDDDGALIEWDFIAKRILRRVQAPFTVQRAVLADNLTAAVFLGKERVQRYDLANSTFREIDTANVRKTDHVEEWGTIAVSRDATTVFISDGKGRIYRSLSGKPFTPFLLTGVTDKRKPFVTSLAVSPDGSTLAIGEFGMIRIVDADTGTTHRLITHDRVSYSVTLAFSPDGTLITAGIPGVATLNHSQQELAIWEVSSGRKRLAVTSPDGVACTGGFSRDGGLALLGFSSNSQLYDLSTGKQLGNTFKALPERTWPWQMDMSPDGAYLLVSGQYGALRVFKTAGVMQAENPKPLARLEKNTSKVEALTFSPDGTRLVLTQESSRVQVLDLKGKRLHAFLQRDDTINDFIFDDQGTRLVQFGPYAISQWHWPSLSPLPPVEFGVKTRSDYLRISPDGRHAVALANNELIGNGFYRLPVLQRLDLARGSVTHSFKLEHLKDDIARFYQLGCVDFMSGTATVIDTDGRGRDDTGRRPSTYHSPDRALVYALNNGSLLRTIHPGKAKAGRFDCEQMQFDDKHYPEQPELEGQHHYNYLETPKLSIRSEDGVVAVIDRHSGISRRIKTLATGFTNWETGNHVTKMALSPDSRLLAVGTNQGDVGLYDLRTEKWLGTYLYLGYGEWIWYTEEGIINASTHGAELVVPKEQ